MGYEYILSIDPGGKGGDTGIVVVRYSKFTAPEFFLKWAIPGGIDGFRDWKGEHKRIVIDAARSDWHVICEHFVQRNIPNADLTPVLVEGAVLDTWRQVILSNPSGKNTAVSDDVLKRLGLYIPGGHHRDCTEAMRHAVRWLKNQAHVPTLQAGWPE